MNYETRLENKLKFHEVLTIKQLAKYLQMNEQTLYRMVKRGKIPVCRIGGSLRFPVDLINKWLGEIARRKHRK